MLSESDRLCKLVPDKIPDKKLNLQNAIDYVPELKAAEQCGQPDSARYDPLRQDARRKRPQHGRARLRHDHLPRRHHGLGPRLDGRRQGDRREDARHAVRGFGDRGHGTDQDGLPGAEDPFDHQGRRGEHPPDQGREDRHRRLHDHQRPRDLPPLRRRPHRRDVPVRVRGHAEVPARAATLDLRGPDRDERPLPARPDGLHPGLHRPQARPQPHRVRHPRDGEVSQGHLRHHGLPGAGHVAVASSGQLHPRRVRTRSARPWARNSRTSWTT